MHDAEAVLVVSKSDVDLPDGPCTFVADDVLAGLHSGDIAAAFAPRSEVETDETRLQIIPYIVVMNRQGVFGYCRAKGGEQRLDGKWSVGIGGHVNDGDRVLRGDSLDVLGTIEMAMYREADEETHGLVTQADCPAICQHDEYSVRHSSYDWRVARNVEQLYPPVCVYTPDNAVGRVHLGIVFPVTVSDKTLHGMSTKDVTLRASRVFSPPVSGVEFERMEAWSQLCLEMIGFR